MNLTSTYVLLVAACAVAACTDPRVRAARWWRVVAAGVGAAVAPALVGALVLLVADPRAPLASYLDSALVAGLVVGLLVAGGVLAARTARAGRATSSPER